MEKKVIINVTSLQRNEAGKDEKITLETPGIYGEKDGMKYVSYEETKLAGMEGTTTTLEIHKDHVRLIRDGSFLQEQVYRIGEKSHSLYETPMGTMDIYVVTREILKSKENKSSVKQNDIAEQLIILTIMLNQVLNFPFPKI